MASYFGETFWKTSNTFLTFSLSAIVSNPKLVVDEDEEEDEEDEEEDEDACSDSEDAAAVVHAVELKWETDASWRESGDKRWESSRVRDGLVAAPNMTGFSLCWRRQSRQKCDIAAIFNV